MKHGFKASFGIITDLIGNEDVGIWERVSVKDIEELDNYGMDIAAHTKTHVNLTQNLCRCYTILSPVNC